MTENDEQLQSLVQTVCATPKYKQVSPDLIQAIGRRELEIRPSWKEAVKATKSKLHQVAGAYQDKKINYDQALKLLQDTAGSPEAFQDSCRQIMRRHLSTQERLPILDKFFIETLAGSPPIRHVIDIACGLNPLARAWMPFANDVQYAAYDIFADGMQFISDFMNIAGINGWGEVRDVLHQPPTQPVDLAMILKTLPILDQLGKTAAFTLLDALQARSLLISYPVASLGGRRKGMVSSYDSHFQNIASRYRWSYRRFEFSTELAFFVQT
jgi:16S rRNA (guanine(1405)-N(7))-methyltransferase